MVNNKERGSILIIDDETDILELLEIIIESEFDVDFIRKTNVSDSLEFLKSNKPDLILANYTVDGGDGLKIYNQIESQSNIPFVFLAIPESSTMIELKGFFESNPLNSFIERPTDEVEILETIKKILNKDISASSTYKKVKVQHLKNMLKNDCNLYLKMSDEKLVKIADGRNLDSNIVLSKYKGRVHYLKII